jgi:hypothetical protein
MLDDENKQDEQQVQCFVHTAATTMNSLMARADEIEMGIKQTLALMNEKRASKVKDVICGSQRESI